MASIQPRWFHASTLVNTTLYFSGGTTGRNLNKTTILDEALALDLSRPWSIDKPLFTTLPRLPVPLTGHSMNRVPGTTQLLVAGGDSTANSTSSPILLYDLIPNTNTNSSSVWYPPRLPANATASFRRVHHASITTGKDGIILQGGYRTTVKNGTVVSSLVTLKPGNGYAPQSTTSIANASNAPALARHTMVLTPDGHAIVLGGINSRGVLANLSTAYVMDTQSDRPEWKAVPLLGTPPEPRVGFTTVMVNSTTLLLFGGTKNFKSAHWVTFYLDLPTWTWSSPTAQGNSPRRWGHTATMAGNTMIVAFGLSSHQKADSARIALLDTTTNTWVTEYRPQKSTSTRTPDARGERDAEHGLSVGAVLALGFVITAALVGGAFFLLVRRTKRKTRNTMARESRGELAPRAALGRRNTNGEKGLLEKVAGAFGPKVRRRDSKRYSDASERLNPSSIADKLTQLGYPPTSFGYPQGLVRQGTGLVPMSDYAYPNQPCPELETIRDGYDVRIVFHDFTLAQKEALKPTQDQEKQLALMRPSSSTEITL